MENSKKETFEKKITELEKTVIDLESGKLSLDATIKKFENGIKLYKDCKTSLEKAEKKIKVLTKNLEEALYEEVE